MRERHWPMPARRWRSRQGALLVAGALAFGLLPALTDAAVAGVPVASFANPFDPAPPGPGNLVSDKPDGTDDFYTVVVKAVDPDGGTITTISLLIEDGDADALFEPAGTFGPITPNSNNAYKLQFDLSVRAPATDVDDDPGILRAVVRDSSGEETTIDQAVVFRTAAETVNIGSNITPRETSTIVNGTVSAGTTTVALSYSTSPRTGTAPTYTACGTATVTAGTPARFSGTCDHTGTPPASITAFAARALVGTTPHSGDVGQFVITFTPAPTTPTTTPPAGGGTGTGPGTTGPQAAGEQGYALVAADGGIFTFGSARFFGSTGALRLNQPIVGMDHTPTTAGYWLVASDGGIFAFGDARFFGSTGAIRLAKPIVGMRSTPSGNGYWLVASDGGIFAFGDARFFGSTGAIRLNQPIVGMERTPSGNGYWLVASDGGIFAFGDAAFRGSTGAIRLNKPIVGMARTNTGGGYHLAASDGGIFAFGDAVFRGSTGAITLNSPITAISPTATGTGYWLCARDGGVFAFGNAQFRGSMGATRLNQPVVGCDAPLTQV